MACKPTDLASLFSLTASTRKITMTSTTDVKYVGEIVCTITGLGEDGRALTGKTGTAKVVIIPTACKDATIKSKVKAPTALTIYYTLGASAASYSFNRWGFTDATACPTNWWTTKMTTSNDAIKTYVTFTSEDRKVNIKQITKSSDTKKLAGTYTRKFKPTPNDGTEISTEATATINIHDPDCASATTTWSPSSTITASTYLLTASASTVTLPVPTVSGSCKTHKVVTTGTTILKAQFTTFDYTTDVKKLKYVVANKDANMGHHTITYKLANYDSASTAVGTLSIPITVSKSACEVALVGKCTGSCKTKETVAAYTIGTVAPSAASIAGLTINVSGCKMDYVPSAVPAALKNYLTLDGKSPNKKGTLIKIPSGTKATGIYDITWTPKTIAKATVQTGITITQTYTIKSTACETTNGNHVTPKGTDTIVFMELNDASPKTEWSHTVSLKSMFTTSVDCFLTYTIDWRAAEKAKSAYTTIKGITKFEHLASSSSVKIKITETTNLVGDGVGWWPFTVTAKTTAGVSFTNSKTATLIVKAYYKSCVGAAVASTFSKPSDKKWKINSDSTSTAVAWDHVVTTKTMCKAYLIYTAGLPDNLKTAKLGVDAFHFTNKYGTKDWGNMIVFSKVQTGKEVYIGSYSVTITLKDFKGLAQTKQPGSTNAQKYLLSDTACETIGSVKLTWTGGDAVTYKLDAATISYPYTVTAATPKNCKYTVTEHTIPSDHSFSTYMKWSAGKFTMNKVSKPNALTNGGTAYVLKVYATTLHGTKVTTTG